MPDTDTDMIQAAADTAARHAPEVLSAVDVATAMGWLAVILVAIVVAAPGGRDMIRAFVAWLRGLTGPATPGDTQLEAVADYVETRADSLDDDLTKVRTAVATALRNVAGGLSIHEATIILARDLGRVGIDPETASVVLMKNTSVRKIARDVIPEGVAPDAAAKLGLAPSETSPDNVASALVTVGRMNQVLHPDYVERSDVDDV